MQLINTAYKKLYVILLIDKYRAVNIQNDLRISVDLHLDEFMYKYVMFAGSGSFAGNGNNFE